MNADTTKRIDPQDDADLEAFDDELDDEDEDEGMSERDFEEFLTEAIDLFADESQEMRRVDIATFEDRGVLTLNRGLVVTIGDQEFQLTIVRSK